MFNGVISNKKALRLIALCCVLLAPFLYLALFCHPIADDLTYAWKGQHTPLLKALVEEHQHWNGRFFSNLIVLINPFGYGSLVGYRLVPILLLISIAASAKHFFRSLASREFSSLQLWFCALVFTLVFTGSMPEIGEGIYWYTGSVSYTLGSILILLSFSFFFRRKRIVAALFLVLGMGCSELCMLVGLSFYLFLFAFSKERNWGLALLAACIAMVVICAPGNAVRGALFANKQLFFHSFSQSIMQCVRFSFTFLSIPLLVLSIAYVPVNRVLSERVELFKRSFGMSYKWSWLLLPFVIFLACFPAYWSTGILGQHRTVNVAYFFWLLLWFMNLSIFFNRFKISTVKMNIAPTMLLVIITLSLAIQKNSLTAYADIRSGSYAIHDKIMQKRWKELENCRALPNGSQLHLSPDTSGCLTLHILPLADYPGHLVNNAYVAYSECKHVSVLKRAAIDPVP